MHENDFKLELELRYVLHTGAAFDIQLQETKVTTDNTGTNAGEDSLLT